LGELISMSYVRLRWIQLSHLVR